MSTSLNLLDLEAATASFFQRHWNISVITEPPPQWSGWHEFHGSVPNYQHAGCYALFEGERLIYIGVGASRGSGRYVDHGLSRRLMSHVLRIDREKGETWSKPRVGWESVTAIYTIGFPRTVAYLSPALETYLIREFSGKLRNSRV